MLAVNKGKKNLKLKTKHFRVRTNESGTMEAGKETKKKKQENYLNPTDDVSTGMNRASKVEWLVVSISVSEYT